MAYEIAIGVGIFSFLLLLFTSQLEKEHTFLKLITVFFAVGILVLIPKIYIEPQCYPVINHTSVAFNYTGEEPEHALLTNETLIYTYMDYCTPDHTDSGVTFLKAAGWFYWCFMGYVFLYIVYEIFFKKTERMLKR